MGERVNLDEAKKALEKWFLKHDINFATVAELGRKLYFVSRRPPVGEQFTPRWLVRWTKNPHPESEHWKGVEGSYEIFCREDKRWGGCVEIIETFYVKSGTHNPLGWPSHTHDLERLRRWIEEVKVKREKNA